MKGLTEPCDFCLFLRSVIYHYFNRETLQKNTWNVWYEFAGGTVGFMIGSFMDLHITGWFAAFAAYVAVDIGVWYIQGGYKQALDADTAGELDGGN